LQSGLAKLAWNVHDEIRKKWAENHSISIVFRSETAAAHPLSKLRGIALKKNKKNRDLSARFI